MTPLLTAEQVAAVLGVPLAVVEGLVQAGELSFYAVGPDDAVRFSEEQARAYLESCERTMMGVEDEDEAPAAKAKPLKHLSVE